MRKLIYSVLIISLFFSVKAFANIDSLKHKLVNSKGLERAIICNNLARYYKTIQPDSCIYFASQAFEFVKNGAEYEKTFKSCTYLADSYRLIGDIGKSYYYLYFSKSIIDKIKREEKVQAYFEISEGYKLLGKLDSALIFARLSLEFIPYTNDTIYIFNAKNNIASIYRLLCRYSEAISYYEEAIALTKERFPLLNAIASSNLALLFNDWGKPTQALKLFNQSIELYQNILPSLSFETINLYNVKENIFKNYNNAAIALTKIGDLKQATIFLKKAASLVSGTNVKAGLAQVNTNLGNVYQELGMLDSALYYFNIACKQCEELNATDGVCINYINLAGVYSQKGDMKNAVKLGEASYKLAIDNSFNFLKKDIIELLVDLYYKAGDFKNAFYFQKKSILLRDSSFNIESKNKLDELQSKFDNETKKIESDNTIRRQKLFVYIYLFIIAFVVMLLVFLYFRYKSKEKTNVLLTEKNNEINIKNTALSELNATKDKFFAIIAHDLKNPVNAVKMFTETISGNLGDFTKEELQDAMDTMYSSANSLSELLSVLLTWAGTQTGKIDYYPDDQNAYFIANNVIELLSMQANAKNITLKSEIKSETNVFADANMLSTIFRNLVSNALKFTNSGGEVSICSQNISEDWIQFEVKDSGIGMKPEIVNRLFKLDGAVKELGTNKETGTGLGLILCKEFVEKHGGKIWAQSELGNGTSFFFTLPNKQF